MADAADRAEQCEQTLRDDALARHAARPRNGCDACVVCGEAISAFRKNLGAQRCVEHQSDYEARMKHRRA